MTRFLALSLTLSSVTLGFVATGCGTTDAAAAPSTDTTNTAQPVAAGAADMQALCVQAMTRARECTSDYIPALVDARARQDKPAGIAAEVAKDRDGVIAQANAEWAEDSKDDHIAAMCEHLAAAATPDQQGDGDVIRGCLASASCSDYTTCVMPVFAKQLR